MDIIAVAKFLIGLVIIICIAVDITINRDIRKFFFREVPIFIAVVGGAMYIVAATAKRDYPIYAIFGEVLIFLGIGFAIVRTIFRYGINKQEDINPKDNSCAFMLHTEHPLL